ncbi:MAG: M15 family metallopeptidase [Bacteroidales bacterium]
MAYKAILPYASVLFLILASFACKNQHEHDGIDKAFDNMHIDDEPAGSEDISSKSDTWRFLDSMGLVDVQTLDSSILVNLRYSSTDNFLDTILYDELSSAFLQADVARKLANASGILQKKHPELRLMVWDAVRPVAVQKRMWENCDIPLKRRHWYVTPPDTRSLHNWGAAVDVTLVDTSGNYLDMGTDFDHFGKAAYTDRDADLLTQGLISQKAVDNRQILKSVMNQAGFTGIKYEWWHYNSCTRKTAESKYKLIFALTDTTKTR